MTSTARDAGPSVHTTWAAGAAAQQEIQSRNSPTARYRERTLSYQSPFTLVLHTEEGVPANTASRPSCTILADSNSRGPLQESGCDVRRTGKNPVMPSCNEALAFTIGFSGQPLQTAGQIEEQRLRSWCSRFLLATCLQVRVCRTASIAACRGVEDSDQQLDEQGTPPGNELAVTA